MPTTHHGNFSDSRPCKQTKSRSNSKLLLGDASLIIRPQNLQRTTCQDRTCKVPWSSHEIRRCTHLLDNFQLFCLKGIDQQERSNLHSKIWTIIRCSGSAAPFLKKIEDRINCSNKPLYNHSSLSPGGGNEAGSIFLWCLPVCLQWQSITLISLCAVNRLVLPLAVSVKNVTENVLFVTVTLCLKPLFEFVTNAIMEPILEDALFVEDQVFLMLIIAKSARSKKKTGMDAQRLSIWALPKQIYFTNAKSMDLKRDSLPGR